MISPITIAVTMLVLGFKSGLMLAVPSPSDGPEAPGDSCATLKLRDVRLDEAMFTLAKTSGLSVLYDPELVDGGHGRRSFEFSDEPVPVVIEKVAKAFNCFPQIDGDWLSVHSIHPRGFEQIVDRVVTDAESLARDKAREELENKTESAQKVQKYLRSLRSREGEQYIYLGSLPGDVRKEAFDLERARRWQTVRAKLREYPPQGKVEGGMRLHSYVDSGKFPMLGFVVLRGGEYTFDYWNTAWVMENYKR
jgi:hypothetical protein